MIEVLRQLPLYFFAIGFAFISYTRLRISGPIGGGEVSLLIAFIMLLFYLRNHFQILSLADISSVFWIMLLLMLLGGYLSAVIQQLDMIGKSSHDFLSFIFCYISYLSFTNLVKIHSLKKVLHSCVSFGFASVVFLLITAFYSGDFLSLLLTRFHGFSKNPNQLALYALILMYFSLCLFRLDHKSKWLSIGCFLLSFICGALTKSDAFFLAVVIFIYGSMVLVTTRNIITRVSAWKKIFSWMFVICTMIGLLMFIGNLIATLNDISNDGGQGSVRFLLWGNGLEAMFTAPIFGVGPGAWSGLSYPLQGHEAHNTFIDFGNSFGLVAVFAYMLLLCHSSFYLLKSRSYTIFCLFWAISIFSVFHYVLRFPFIWVVIAMPTMFYSELKRT